jgi:hypothetical protein
MLTDVAISGDRNVIDKKTEKILKYKDLTTEIQRMRDVKTKVIPLMTGATRTISKSYRKYRTKCRESTKSSKYRKQPYWALHTYFRKY